MSGLAGGGEAGGEGGAGGSEVLGPGWPDSATAFCSDGLGGGGGSPCDSSVPSPQDGHRNDIMTPVLDFSSGIVTDGLTTLRWTYGGQGSSSWDAARETCAGRGDMWRLPTAIELTSMADYGHPSSVFEASLGLGMGTSVWTSHEDASNADNAWIVAAGGSWASHAKSAVRRVVCVEGELPGADPVVVVETYTDRTTRLEWRRNVSNAQTWPNAVTACPSQYGAGWRLPTIKELTILDFEARQLVPDIAPVFTNLWSATPSRSQSGGAWALAPTFSTDLVLATTASALFLCVRSL